MSKIKRLIFTFTLIIFTSNTFAHVSHYSSLNKLEFDIYRNNKHIGTHIFNFKKLNDNLTVESEVKFQIKKLGVVLYKYRAVGTEFYNKDKFIKYTGKTNQNGKEKYANITRKTEEGILLIDGSSYKGKAPVDFLVGTWWNHEITQAKAQISAISGRIIEQKVVFLGKETINLNGKDYKTLHFNFSSTDKKLDKDKKLNTHIWYDEKTLNWVKASFNKKGKWEYRLKSVD